MEIFTKEQKEFLSQSMQWIKNHPNAKIYDIPENLFQGWKDPLFDGKEKGVSNLQFAVFMYIYSTYMEKANREMSEEEIAQKYMFWQIKLSARVVNKITEMGCENFPAFSFDGDDELRFYRKYLYN